MTVLIRRDSFATGGKARVIDDAAFEANPPRVRSFLAPVRAARAWSARRDVALIGITWACVAFGTLIWSWGLNPLVFQVTDEAVVRQAARLVCQHGSLLLKLPFADPEDLAHMRSWVSSGDTALPTYAPLILYLYGLLLRLRTVGLLLIELLPASGLGAFAAGTAALLPSGRRWLAWCAPLLGFASFYWVLHPWILLSPVLVGECWAFFFWTRWRADARLRWLAALAACVGFAAAVRPDYAGFLLLSMLLISLATHRSQWRWTLALAIAAGIGALVPNLILNKLSTGHALRAVYQIALDRQYGADGTHGLDNSGGLPGLGVLRVLLMPMGFPTFDVFRTEFKKYFITMSVAPVLILGQLALIPILRDRPRSARFFSLAALLLMGFFTVTHLHNEVYGGGEAPGYLSHSAPRYLSPIFLLTALPPIFFLGQCRNRVVFALGSALAYIVAGVSAYEVYVNQPASLAAIHRWVPARTALLDVFAAKVPSNAIVYSSFYDKVVWSRWNVGVIADPPDQTVSSMSRAVAAGLPVFVFEPKPPQLRSLRVALQRQRLTLVRLDARHGLYRLDQLP